MLRNARSQRASQPPLVRKGKAQERPIVLAHQPVKQEAAQDLLQSVVADRLVNQMVADIGQAAIRITAELINARREGIELVRPRRLRLSRIENRQPVALDCIGHARLDVPTPLRPPTRDLVPGRRIGGVRQSVPRVVFEEIRDPTSVDTFGIDITVWLDRPDIVEANLGSMSEIRTEPLQRYPGRPERRRQMRNLLDEIELLLVVLLRLPRKTQQQIPRDAHLVVGGPFHQTDVLDPRHALPHQFQDVTVEALNAWLNAPDPAGR